MIGQDWSSDKIATSLSSLKIDAHKVNAAPLPIAATSHKLHLPVFDILRLNGK